MTIYFLRSETADKLIKIGYSSQINKRIRALQTASPVKLNLIGTIEGELELEAKIKARFASLCVRGEWFRPDDVLTAFIKTEVTKTTKKFPPRVGRAKSGRAKVSIKKQAAIFTPKDFKLALRLCDYDRHDIRNKVIIWFSFGCGLRVTEIALLKVKDVIEKNGEIITNGWIPGTYSKNHKGRYFYVVEDEHVSSIKDYIEYRVANKMRVSDAGKYQGLAPESPFLLVTKYKGFSFIKKYYTNEQNKEVEYRVCSSLQQLLSNLLLRSSVKGASSHSGRRTLATRLADRGVDIGLIQYILGHGHAGQTIDYIEPNQARLRDILKSIYR